MNEVIGFAAAVVAVGFAIGVAAFFLMAGIAGGAYVGHLLGIPL